MLISQVKTKGENPMIKKRISVSQKRQITIPIDFYNSVGIDKEVECYVQNNAIVIRPVRESGGEFDELILADLIAQGLSGQELLDKFKESRRKIRPAVQRLLEEARLAAQGQTSSDSYEGVFGSEAD
jgi:bifunctional DNA-binding transcriptional regulator/antitoxin component of YhaV-PrlF toxin-antitoxin module